MSKHYGRVRTPPSPPPSSYRNSNHSSKSYDIGSKTYSSKEYSDRSLSKYDKDDKYGQYDKYDKYDKYNKYDGYDEKYDKYDKSEKSHYDKIEKHSQYEKSERNSRYDKYEKSDYKQSYSSSKEFGDLYYSPKKAKASDKFERDDRLLPTSYKSKSSSYSTSSYSDRESYSTKYSSRSNDNFSLKYTSQDLRDDPSDKYSSRSNVSRYSDNGKKYDTYSKNSSFPKYGSLEDPYYDSQGGDYDSYSSYHSKADLVDAKLSDDRRDYGNSSLRVSEKSYSRGEFSNNSDSYQRYVIGDSVVYGSPGHNPEDLYPASPKLKRKSGSSLTSISPSKHGGSSSSKSYSRYSPSSPKRFKGSSDKLSHSSIRSSYSDRSKSPSRTSSFRKPLSPLPHRSLSPQGYPQNGKSAKSFSDLPRSKDGRYSYSKLDRDYSTRSRPSEGRSRALLSRMRDRTYADSGKPSRRPLVRNSDSQDFRGGSFRRGSLSMRSRFMGTNLLPRPTSPPKPLLSIPLTESSLPKSSRERYRETISHADNLRPTLPLRDRERGGLARRRFEGRMRQFQTSNLGGRSLLSQRKRVLSPRDKRRRRPDDLRLWIESRKSESNKRNSSPSGRTGGGRSLLSKQSSGGKEVPASLRMRSLLESKKRLMAKNRARGLPLKKLPLKKPRRPVASRKSREKETSSHGDKKPRSSPKEENGHKKETSHHKREGSGRDNSYKREGSGGLQTDSAPRREKSSRDRKEATSSDGPSQRSKATSLEAKVKAKSRVGGASASSSKKSIKRSSHKVASGSSKLLLKRRSAKLSSSSARKAESSEKSAKVSSKRSSSKDADYAKKSSKKEISFSKDEKFLDMDM